jgi:ubiquinone/menaquinone biosynthesis C-methylase UbiE
MHAAEQNNSPAAAAAAAAPEDIVLQRIIQQFEGRAATYDCNNTYHPPLAQRLLQLLALQPGDRLLDLAAGTGIVALAAAAAVAPSGGVVLVDISSAMLDQARSKYEAAQQPASEHAESGQLQQQQQMAAAHFFLGDIEQLHTFLPADWLGSFTASTCSAAVPFLRNPTAALASWRAWLKQPGGKLAFNAFVPPAIEDYGTFVRLAEKYGYPPEFDPSEVLGSTERVTAALREAGYSHIQASFA